MSTARNVLGGTLLPCSFDPLTGFHRDGCCDAVDEDAGRHVICARLTVGFLNHQMERGNDLITPRPEFRFPGLRPGDRWCVCALRWREALADGHAPPVLLECTSESALALVPLDALKAHALKAVS